MYKDKMLPATMGLIHKGDETDLWLTGPSWQESIQSGITDRQLGRIYSFVSFSFSKTSEMLPAVLLSSLDIQKNSFSDPKTICAVQTCVHTHINALGF